jgi:hypothetical protein
VDPALYLSVVVSAQRKAGMSQGRQTHQCHCVFLEALDNLSDGCDGTGLNTCSQNLGSRIFAAEEDRTKDAVYVVDGYGDVWFY